MKNKKSKVTIFVTLLILMISYIIWIFYMSEPTYTDNVGIARQGKINKYDVVSTIMDNNLCIGVVIQIDSISTKDTRAIVKNFEYTYKGNEYTTIHLSKIPDKDSTKTGLVIDYRIVGHGTFYHKVNSMIGFNIMMWTVGLSIIMLIVIAITLIRCLYDFMGWEAF